MTETTEVLARMRQVLFETIKILFPVSVDPDEIIIQHVWRDRDYLGEHDGKVPVWRGWSANLHRLDPAYRTLYIDIGENVHPIPRRVAIFGEEFAKAIADKPLFVIMFVVDCPSKAKDLLIRESFVPRRINDQIIHACVVARPEDFLNHPVLVLAAVGAKLVNLQKELSAMESTRYE